MVRGFWFSAFLACATLPLAAQMNVPQEAVQSLFKTKCLGCHNQRNRTSGLALDARDAFLTGGNRGPAIKPGCFRR